MVAGVAALLTSQGVGKVGELRCRSFSGAALHRRVGDSTVQRRDYPGDRHQCSQQRIGDSHSRLAELDTVMASLGLSP